MKVHFLAGRAEIAQLVKKSTGMATEWVEGREKVAPCFLHRAFFFLDLCPVDTRVI